MAEPQSSPRFDGERSPKRRRISSDDDELTLPAPNQPPRLRPLPSAITPSISITGGSESPKRPDVSALDTDDAATPRNSNLSAVETPRSHRSSQRSSQIDSEDERSSPIPSDPDGEAPPMEYPPEVRYRPTLILHGHKRGVACVKFSPDGKWIASCSADATLRTFSAHTGAPQHIFHGHLAGLSTLDWSPDSRTIATGSDDKTIRLWEARTGKPVTGSSGKPRAPLLGHHNYVYSVAFSPKGNMLVSGSSDEAVHLWDVRSGALMRSLPAHSDPVGGVDFVNDGTLIVSCSSDGLIRVWDTATGQCLRTFFHEDTPPVVSVRFTPNGRFITAWMLDSCVRVWDYREGRCVKTFQGHRNEKYSLVGAFGSYGDEEDIERDTLEANGGEEAGLEHEGRRRGIKRAFLASGSEDGSVMIWDVVSKNVLQKLEGHKGVVLSVDTHPTEKMIVSGGMDRVVRIWRDADEGALMD